MCPCSSAGPEHLATNQGVGSSNLSRGFWVVSSADLEHEASTLGVPGSNPGRPIARWCKYRVSCRHDSSRAYCRRCSCPDSRRARDKSHARAQEKANWAVQGLVQVGDSEQDRYQRKRLVDGRSLYCPYWKE